MARCRTLSEAYTSQIRTLSEFLRRLVGGESERVRSGIVPSVVNQYFVWVVEIGEKDKKAKKSLFCSYIKKSVYLCTRIDV